MADSTIKKNLTTREWRYIISIIIIVEAFIAYLSFNYASNASALGYVSFAGTLISIILAVLAIGYTYGESVKQKNSSDTVVNQINKLNEVIKEIDISVDSLDKISTVTEDLKQLSKSFKNGLSRIDDTHKNVITLDSFLREKFNINKLAKHSKEENIGDKTEIISNIVKSNYTFIEYALYILLLYKQSNTEQKLVDYANGVISKYLKLANNDDAVKEKIIKGEHKEVDYYLKGGITSIIQTLFCLQLITRRESKSLIDEDLEGAIRKEKIEKFEVDGSLTSRIAELMVLDIEGVEQTW